MSWVIETATARSLPMLEDLKHKQDQAVAEIHAYMQMNINIIKTAIDVEELMRYNRSLNSYFKALRAAMRDAQENFDQVYSDKYDDLAANIRELPAPTPGEEALPGGIS